MMPGLGGMNPKKMQAMMKQLGLKQEEIPVKRVIFERDEGNIIIDNPNVQKIEMAGSVSWQVQGDEREESLGLSEEELQLVIDKTGKSKEEVLSVFEETKDLAETIVRLS